MTDTIKAIIFDWGGVCCKEGEPFASPALQSALGATPEEIAEKAKDIYTGYYIGAYDGASFWKAIMRHFGLEETQEINPAALSDAYLRSYEIYPDVLQYIGALRKKYTVGLLSDLTPEMRDEIRREHDLQKYFDQEVYSCDADVQARKPDRKIFRHMLDKINLMPDQCVFIDNVPRNAAAAAALGMRPLVFKNRAQFFEDIRTYIDV